jgi:hypothetical protein
MNFEDEWHKTHPLDHWVYDKLLLSNALGYTCGPVGIDVPTPGQYIIRPVHNYMGMGRFSRIASLTRSTDHLHPGEFWCEVFKGPHFTVDFHNGVAELVVKGVRKEGDPLWKWSRWTRVNKKFKLPKILQDLHGKYEWINCEFIGDRLIEVHFRKNPDFRFGNKIAIPVWDGSEIKNKKSQFHFVEDKDYHRRGFYIK